MTAKGFTPTLTNGDLSLPSTPGAYAARVDEEVRALYSRAFAAPVRLAATGNVALSNGLEAGDTIDGVTLVAGDLVLLPAQSTANQCGIYTAVTSGAATRTSGFTLYNQHPGLKVSVREGTAYADTEWLCTSNAGGTIDSTALAFVKVRPASTTDVLTGTDPAVSATPDAIASLWEKGANVAAAATISLGEGGYFHITGIDTITDIDFAVAKDGRKAILIFDSAPTLTHNATSLILPTGANIVAAAGDCCLVVQESGDNIRVVWYQRAAGTPLAGAGGSNAGYDLIDVYDTGQFGEMRTTIAMGTSPGTLVPIYRIPLEVQAGDILFITTEAEFTNPSAQAYNYSVAHALAVGPVADFSSTFVYAGILLGETQGDITGDQHLVVDPAGSIVCPYSGVVYVALLAYAYSSAAGGGDTLTVEQGSGKLTCFQYRKVSSTFIANAVSFDGSSDYLTRGAGVDATADGKAITISAWCKRIGSNGSSGVVVSSATAAAGGTTRLRLVSGNNNEFAVGANNSGGTLILNVSTSNNVYEQADGWVHILLSIDLSNPSNRAIYINDTLDAGATWTTYTNDTIDLTVGDWSIGAHPDGSVKLAQDLAEIWVSDEYIDLSVTANRRRFITAGLKPAYIGPNGALAGNPVAGNYRMPVMYFTGSTSNWHLQRGLGGPFTVHGGLSTAGTTPS